jgi:hypothetical protein
MVGLGISNVKHVTSATTLSVYQYLIKYKEIMYLYALYSFDKLCNNMRFK